MSKLDHTLELKPSLRRVEVITGTGRRRQFSANDKARIIEETLAPGAVVSEVARRYGLMPQQLFTWRRLARQPVVSEPTPEPPMFVPAVVDTSTPPSEPRRRRSRRGHKTAESAGMIEMKIRPRNVGEHGMADTVLAQLAALKTAPVGVLKQKWRDLFGKDPPPYNRRFLENRLAYRIQELAYGGLSQETIERLDAL